MSHSENSHEEKRDFIRMKIALPLTGTLTCKSASIVGQCHELSGGGLQLELPEPLAEGSEWELHLAAEHDQGAQLRAMVKVVRSIAEGDRYHTGFEIVRVIE